MVSKDRSWWQKAKKPLIIVAVIAALVVTVVLIFVVVRFYGTGFDEYDKLTTIRTIGKTTTITKEYQRGKTLWDWMSLLIIPVTLALVGFFFTRTERKNEQAIAKQRAETEQDLSIDNQQEAALQGYLDRMSALLLEKNLRESRPGEEVRTVARVRTLTMLFQLNTRRINYMLAFLRESKLVTAGTDTSIITFSKADLSNANYPGVDFHSIDLSNADLGGANLSGANLSRANLSRANLSEANLSEANLSRVNLSGANLIGANLSGANLSRADLSEAYLFEANLSGVGLSGANLSRADLTASDLTAADLTTADLSEANLSEANLSEADLSKADLSKVELRGANLSKANLKVAKLQGAKYNTKVVQEKDVIIFHNIEPTQWPQGFDPMAAGAICVDC